ncbi:unnamed protein product [Phytomonas sp. Hart1]|nr:unnamed protein product [Phytomonas sp. Hart1]|eukprot:CCW66544.1 unnamed protein product [Phytomonas sp. isolate Hart1]
MFKRIGWLRIMEGERKYNFVGEAPIQGAGGLPFYGNLYTGRVDSQNYVPQRQGGSYLLEKNGTLWDDTAVRAKIEKCPYFALSDQVLYHNMDPVYLDPGVLTPEEHHLLLLFSRAYFEKWKVLHKRPPNGFKRIRITYGGTQLLDNIISLLNISSKVAMTLKMEYFLDDASLIAMNPQCWDTAYLDPLNMDHFSGRVLEFGDMPKFQREQFFMLLNQMRRIVVERRDTMASNGGVPERVVLPFTKGVTLYDLYKELDLPPYSGQLKVYNLIDRIGTKRVQTLKDEDTYFDFLVLSFYKANLNQAVLSEDLADEMDNTCHYHITVEPFTVMERRVGRWF